MKNYPKYSLNEGGGGFLPGQEPIAPHIPTIDKGIDDIPASVPAGPEPAFVPENARSKGTAPVAEPQKAAAAPTPEPEPAKVVEPPKAEEQPDEFGGLRKKAAASAAQAEKPKPATDEPKTPKALREAYDLTKKERDELKQKYEELQKAKEDGTKAEIEKARAEYKTELESLKKKYEDAETKTRYLDYTRSDEYSEKFEKPIASAWQAAMRDLKGVTVMNSDGTERAATPQDIAELAGLDPGPAWKRAKEMFGDLAPEVMGHRKEILRLNEAKQTAIDEWKTKGSELQERERKSMAEIHERLIRNFDDRQQELRKSAPDLFDVPESDAEVKKYVTDAENMNALAFKGQGLRDGVTPEERRSIVTKAQADIAARNRSWPFHVLRANRAEAEVEKLKSELAKLRGTEPAPGGGNIAPSEGGKKAATSMDDITSGIDEIPAIGRA